MPRTRSASKTAMMQELVSAQVETQAIPAKRKAGTGEGTALSKKPRKSQPKAPKKSKVVEDLRPEPQGEPEVWAEDRQSLCETLPYYRAFMGAAYHRDEEVRGILLGKDSAERAHLDTVVAITRASGHCGPDNNGHINQISDQDGEKHPGVKAFRNNMEHKIPIIVIAGRNNISCPTKLPHEYNVLDYFMVTDVWAEMNNGCKCYKYRLEKLDPFKPSWWAPRGSSAPSTPDFKVSAPVGCCSLCDTKSKQVFEEGWMCLTPSCKNFWHFSDGSGPGALNYSHAFLQERTMAPQKPGPKYAIRTPLVQNEKPSDALFPYKEICSRGFVCPKCGRCNTRIEWHQWKCVTPGCGSTHRVPQKVLKASEVQGDGLKLEDGGYPIYKDKCTEAVKRIGPQFVGSWRVNTFELTPGNRVVHFQSNSVINSAAHGPDELYTALQTDNRMKLKRFPMKQSRGTGGAVASHYSVNFGAPYKYVVATDCVGFGEAPAGVIDALQRLTWAGRKAVQDGTFINFNELLAVGYFEKGSMGYHDDGEEGLSPTIATLSLGGSSTMRLRLKERYFSGETKSGRYDPYAPVLPGSLLEHERKELNKLHGKIPDAKFNDRRRVIYEKKPLRIKKCPALIEMDLHHGDMVVMHGAKIQKYYEHEVAMTGPMRYGLTCRAIDMTSADPEELKKADTSSRMINPYNGDEPVSPTKNDSTVPTETEDLIQAQKD